MCWKSVLGRREVRSLIVTTEEQYGSPDSWNEVAAWRIRKLEMKHKGAGGLREAGGDM